MAIPHSWLISLLKVSVSFILLSYKIIDFFNFKFLLACYFPMLEENLETENDTPAKHEEKEQNFALLSMLTFRAP